MFFKLKVAIVAAIVSLMPALTSAASMSFNEGGSTLIELENTYSYAQAGLTGSGSLSFELTATPPSELELATEFSILEFTGNFVNLMIQLTTGEGVEDATLLSSNGNVTAFKLDTVFNASRTFTQNLLIKWDDVTAGPSAQAGVLIEAIPSQVPVPAAGLLLLGALGGVGALRRRKKA